MSGFQQSRNQSGADTTGKVFTYDVAAAHSTRLAPGDVVDLTGTSTAGTGVPQADAAGTTGQILGVIASVDITYAGEALSDTGLPALTGGSIKVNVDPFTLFEVDVANGPLVVANVGLNANQVVTEATLNGGLTVSNMTLNATGIAATVTLPWEIVALREDEDGVLGNRALVRPNTTTLSAGTVGA